MSVDVCPDLGLDEVVLDRHEAYRRGLCVDCRECAHSAGRPRCEKCHSVYITQGSGRGPAIGRGVR